MCDRFRRDEKNREVRLSDTRLDLRAIALSGWQIVLIKKNVMASVT
jgi:hypothetical protein